MVDGMCRWVVIFLCAAASAAAAANDAVVTVVPPLRAVIPSDKPDIAKRVRVRVTNANAVETQTLELTAASADCPPGTLVGQPDFQSNVPGAQTMVTLAARKARQAIVELNVSTAFETFNRATPNRCSITFTVASTAIGNVDPTPDNNVTTMELNVFDLSDDEQATVHESIVESYRAAHPGKIEIFAGNGGKSDTVRVTVTNGDAAETTGDVLTLIASDGDCPPGTVGVPDFDDDAPGSQNSILVAGQRSARGRLPIHVQAADFFSPARQSLARCTAELTVSGPGGDSDSSNNVTRVPIGVFDRNDL